MKNLLFLSLFIWMSWTPIRSEVLSCRSSHLSGTLNGYHCTNDNDTIMDIAVTEQRQCLLLCMRHVDCMVLEFSEGQKQCRLANELCYEAEERADIKMTALGPPRLGCIEWRSNSETLPLNLLVRVNEVGGSGHDKVLGRLLNGGLLLPGFSSATAGAITSTYNSQACSSETGEFLVVSPGCPILWVPWSGTPGADLPTGALVGGHLDDATHLYVAKAWVADQAFRLGYYNPVTGLGYFWYYQTRATSQVSLLVLL